MNNCQKENCQKEKHPLLNEAVWRALMNLPALRYMKAPVDTVAQLYEKYPIGNEKETFAFVNNENTFYIYHPTGSHRGEWKPISADGISSFFEIDTDLLKKGDVLIWDSIKEKFVFESSNVIFNPSDYYTVNETQEIIKGKANLSLVNDIAASVDVLSVEKADKDIVDALMNGIIKQPAVDTYNDISGGKTSLLSQYPNPKVGYDVYVIDENTRYNWNGNLWVNMNSGIYDETIATKEQITELESFFSLDLVGCGKYELINIDYIQGSYYNQQGKIVSNQYWEHAIISIDTAQIYNLSNLSVGDGSVSPLILMNGGNIIHIFKNNIQGKNIKFNSGINRIIISRYIGSTASIGIYEKYIETNLLIKNAQNVNIFRDADTNAFYRNTLLDFKLNGVKGSESFYLVQLYNNDTANQIEIKNSDTNATVCNYYNEGKESGIKEVILSEYQNSGYSGVAIVNFDLLYNRTLPTPLYPIFNTDVIKYDTLSRNIISKIKRNKKQIYKPYNLDYVNKETVDKLNSILPIIQIIGTPEDGYKYILRTIFNKEESSQIQINKINTSTNEETVIINSWVGTKRTGIAILEGATLNNSGYSIFAIIDWDKLYRTPIETGYYYFNTEQVFINTASLALNNTDKLLNIKTNHFPFVTEYPIVQRKLGVGIIEGLYLRTLDGSTIPKEQFYFSRLLRGNNATQITIEKKAVNGLETIVANFWTDKLLKGVQVLKLEEFQNSNIEGYIRINLDKVEEDIDYFDKTYYFDNERVFNNQLFYDVYNSVTTLSSGLIGKKGKTLLAIGDSLTAAQEYQKIITQMLGMIVQTHAKGGAGIIQMIDGYGDLPPLSVTDVTDVDVITLYGGYNNRNVEHGQIGDIYPTNNTITGMIQYAINRIYELLKQANNMQCKIVIITPHCGGKYDWSDVDGYTEYPTGTGRTLEGMANAIKTIANYNSLPCIDLWHNSGINKFTWDTFQKSPVADYQQYIGRFATANELPRRANKGDRAKVDNYSGSYNYNGVEWNKDEAPYPWNADQLHCNTLGYAKLGECIARCINLI